MEHKKLILSDELHALLQKSNGQGLLLGEVMNSLSERAQAVMLIVLSLPFCQPITIPGASIFFGCALIFLGLRIAFGHHVWLPKFLSQRHVNHITLEKLVAFSLKLANALRFIISTRLVWLVHNKKLHIAHGLVVAILALLLALPLPIPLTNQLAAYPILFFGFGMIEDDGIMIIIAYILSLCCFLAFFVLFLMGKEWIVFLLNSVIDIM